MSLRRLHCLCSPLSLRSIVVNGRGSNSLLPMKFGRIVLRRYGAPLFTCVSTRFTVQYFPVSLRFFIWCRLSPVYTALCASFQFFRSTASFPVSLWFSSERFTLLCSLIFSFPKVWSCSPQQVPRLLRFGVFLFTLRKVQTLEELTLSLWLLHTGCRNENPKASLGCTIVMMLASVVMSTVCTRRKAGQRLRCSTFCGRLS